MSGIDWQILGSVFEEEPGVIAAWVFGSAQEGVVRPEGDLDIGVLDGRLFDAEEP
jgi:predicted nucleotidyltransferase